MNKIARILFLMVGCNETSMILSLFALVMTNIYMYQRNKRIDFYLLQILTIALIGSFVVLLAPGNFVRSSYFEKSNRLFRTLHSPIPYIPIYFISFLNIPSIPCLNEYLFGGDSSADLKQCFYSHI